MPRTLLPYSKCSIRSFAELFEPIQYAMIGMPPLHSRGNRPLNLSFEDHLRTLVFFHLEEHTSAQHLLQVLKEDDFARENIAPEKGIEKSSFSEANNSRGLEQFLYVFQNLQNQAHGLLPMRYPELGNLTAIDGSLIDAVLSMTWADYRKGSKKAKVHVGFDINRGIPRKVFLTDGKGAERNFVGQILSPGETGVLDRGYQCHKRFDEWQEQNQLFLCRVKESTHKTIVLEKALVPGSIVFFDAIVLLGTPGINQTEKELRLVGYEVDKVKYWIATNRFDLTGEQVALAYKLRWDIEKFFAWWKRHLKVYHLIARSEHGLMVQILAGLITYLLLAIHCYRQHNERVSIKRVRELRIKIQNEINALNREQKGSASEFEKEPETDYAKT